MNEAAARQTLRVVGFGRAIAMPPDQLAGYRKGSRLAIDPGDPPAFERGFDTDVIVSFVSVAAL